MRRLARSTTGARAVAMLVTAVLSLALTSCDNGGGPAAGSAGSPAETPTGKPTAAPSTAAVVGDSAPSTSAVPPPFRHPIPGMPPLVGHGVYAAARAGSIQPSLRGQPQLLYVPDSEPNGHTTVISQRTHRIVRVLPTGDLDQHVTPSWDLKTLYVEASTSNHLAKIDPATGRMTGTVATNRPYNLYFVPNGRQAIVMDEEHDEIVFSNPHTFARQQVVSDPTCSGPNHADFSANGRYFIVSCEFSGALLKVSTLGHKVIGRIRLPMMSMPQDVRLAPDGRSFFVADMGRDKLLQLGWRRFRIQHAYPTLAMPHGIYFSRDQRVLYLSARKAGAVEVFDLARHRFTHIWRIPGGGSPDMGGLSADGRTLWLSGRYDGVVYAFDTRTGRVTAKIKVPGGSPHGLLVWPQPGRYSLGHTGLMR